MFCKFCGKEVVDDAVICVHCGRQIKHDVQKSQSSAAKTLAICGFVFSFIFALVGLILSIISLCKYKKQDDKSGKGFATAGLIISIVAICLFVLLYAIIIITAISVANAAYQASYYAYAAISL